MSKGIEEAKTKRKKDGIKNNTGGIEERGGERE